MQVIGLSGAMPQLALICALAGVAIDRIVKNTNNRFMFRPCISFISFFIKNSDKILPYPHYADRGKALLKLEIKPKI